MTKQNLQLSVIDKKGKGVASLELSPKIFGADVNAELIAQAVKVYLSNQRSAYPKTKRRGEVKGSGRKIWPQKGTGRARHGDQYAPIFVGGGIAHGPRGNQVYKKKFPKKMNKRALISVLSAKQKEGKIKIVKGIKRLRKTKSADECVKSWFGKDFNSQKKYLLIVPGRLEGVNRAFRNLSYLGIISADQLNVYQALKHDWLILLPEAVEILEKRLLK